MSERPEVADLVHQWMQKADNDLLTAEHTLLLSEGCPCDTSWVSDRISQS